MTSRSLYIGTICVILGFVVILLLNIAGSFGALPGKYISLNQVKGTSIEHNGKMYTLNLAQQTTLIDILNRSIILTPTEKEKMHSEVPGDVSKIVINRFKEPDITIKLVGYIGKDSKNPSDRMITMVYSAPDWSKSLLEESFPNEMIQLFSTAYDK